MSKRLSIFLKGLGGPDSLFPIRVSISAGLYQVFFCLQFRTGQPGRSWRRKTKCEMNSNECKNCASQLLDRIEASGVVDSNLKKQIARRIGVDDRPSNASFPFNRGTQQRCNRYRFSKNIRKFTTGELQIPSPLQAWAEGGRRNFQRIQQSKRKNNFRSGRGQGRNTRTRSKRANELGEWIPAGLRVY